MLSGMTRELFLEDKNEYYGEKYNYIKQTSGIISTCKVSFFLCIVYAWTEGKSKSWKFCSKMKYFRAILNPSTNKQSTKIHQGSSLGLNSNISISTMQRFQNYKTIHYTDELLYQLTHTMKFLIISKLKLNMFSQQHLTLLNNVLPLPQILLWWNIEAMVICQWRYFSNKIFSCKDFGEFIAHHNFSILLKSCEIIYLSHTCKNPVEKW